MPQSLLDRLSSNRKVALCVYLVSFIACLLVVVVPTVIGLAINYPFLYDTLKNESLISDALRAIGNSFWIATVVTLFDLATGFPLAWYIARSKSPLISLLDTLVDLPLVMPTAALGYSLLLFWGEDVVPLLLGDAFAVKPGWALVILLHITFSYTYIVRTIVGILTSANLSYEMAARTLGASPLTTARTVSIPIIKLGIVSAAILAFARSLAETGATMMVAGAFYTAPIFIKEKLTAGERGVLVFTSLVLIALSLATFAIIDRAARKVRLRIPFVFPELEKKLSHPKFVFARNVIFIILFFALVFVPAFYLTFPAMGGFSTLNDPSWNAYWSSLLISVVVASSTTVLSILLGIPLSIAIARRKYGKFTPFVDSIVNIPLIVPTIALGTSLRLFWVGLGFSEYLPEILLLILAHMSFTLPFVVRSTVAAIEGISEELEDVARTLGASPYRVFRTITFPLCRSAVVAGAILAFARSMDETGATMAVCMKLRTAPVLLVEWVKSMERGLMPPSQPALGCFVMLAISFVLILILKVATWKRVVYA